MSKRGNERRVIKNRQAKSYEVNRADDPESFFKFKLRRAHGKQCSGGRLLAKAFGVSVTKLIERFQPNRRSMIDERSVDSNERRFNLSPIEDSA